MRELRLWRCRWVIGKQNVEFDLSEMQFSDDTDAVDVLQRLQQGVLMATEQFLKAHPIDTTFVEQAKQIINHHGYTFNGAVNGQGNNFGGHGIVNTGGGGPAQGLTGPGAASSAPPSACPAS
ncbi:hypothetical protein ACGFXC_30340 [Streptomyces sp. NPDC048507]|uniref:hypothetical protein n=1 Tax=Streptomyces sp. NPDC048507 TaxID=3365560 RepID=UPI0037170903